MSSLPTQASSSSDSVSLVVALQAGSSEAWERLVEIYAPLVRAWCRSTGLPEASIPDIAQEVFLAVYRRVSEFSPRSNSAGFQGWLWTITRNVVRDYFRKLGGARGVGGSAALAMLHTIPDPELPDEPPSGPNETAALLRRALDYVRPEFQQRTWTAFWRTTVKGEGTADVAAELGVSSAAVRQSRARVLRRLRQQLGDML